MTQAVSEPIFKSVFGTTWDDLPVALKWHYANRPFCKDRIEVRGQMWIEIAPIMRLFTPILSLFGMLVPRSGRDIEVRVAFLSQADKVRFKLARTFQFPDGKTFRFVSNMEVMTKNQVIERMGPGIGWQTLFSWDGNRVHLSHKAYSLRLFGRDMVLPVEFLFGRGYAWDEAEGETGFAMYMEIRHAWWGRLYAYGGRFAFSEIDLVQ